MKSNRPKFSYLGFFRTYVLPAVVVYLAPVLNSIFNVPSSAKVHCVVVPLAIAAGGEESPRIRRRRRRAGLGEPLGERRMRIDVAAVEYQKQKKQLG